MQYFEHHIYTSNCRVIVQVLIKKQNHTYSRLVPVTMVDAGVAGRRLRVEGRGAAGRAHGGGRTTVEGQRRAGRVGADRRRWWVDGGPGTWGRPRMALVALGEDGDGGGGGCRCESERRRRGSRGLYM
jgi:hypothetical protein